MQNLSFPQLVVRLRSAGCVFAEDEAGLLLAEVASESELAQLANRRVSGEPLEYVLGWASFCGRRILVGPGVFVPRRRTELLAESALALTRPGSSPVVVDMCCGTGAVGAAIMAARPTIRLYASDIEPAAVACARRNLPKTPIFMGDLFEPLPAWLKGRVQILVANAPYVPTSSINLMPSEARDHEPLSALDGGADGLDVQRAVLAHAAEWLTPGGHALVETSREQAPATLALFSENYFEPRVVRCEDADATVVIGRLRH